MHLVWSADIAMILLKNGANANATNKVTTSHACNLSLFLLSSPKITPNLIIIPSHDLIIARLLPFAFREDFPHRFVVTPARWRNQCQESCKLVLLLLWQILE